MSQPLPLTVAQLQTWFAEGKPLRLLDVRTHEERTYTYIVPPDGVAEQHMPMHLVPLRANEIPDDDIPLVVYCHHGVRSHQVGLFLSHHGFENVYNLQGGIHAWATLDPSVKRYDY